MERNVTVWLSALTGAVGVLIVGVIVGLAAMSADVAQLDEQVTALTFGATREPAGVTERLTSPPLAAAAGRVQIDEVVQSSRALSVTLTIRWSGAADPLYLPPVVRDGAGRDYAVTAASLRATRQAWLALTTAGEATGTLVFEPGPPATGALTLTLNPGMPVGDVVAPRLDVIVRAGE